MRIKILPSNINGVLEIPTAKAQTHRYILATFLSRNGSYLEGDFQGEDISATLDAVEALGAEVEKKYNFDNKLIGIKITNNAENGLYCDINDTLTLNMNESGSTLRFMLPICAALGRSVNFVGEGRLGQRPIKELANLLTVHGTNVSSQCLPLEISGHLKSGRFEICGGVSSQYISGLLFALPILNGDSELRILGESVSQNYIDMTLDTLKDFGIKISKADCGYKISGSQKYVAKDHYVLEGDWSSASFFAVLGALCGGVKIKGVKMQSKQSDMAVCSLLKDAGAIIKAEGENVCFEKSKLCAIKFSGKNCPDLTPIMAVACAFFDGVSEITDVDRLKIKESDRLKAIIDTLKVANVKINYCDSNGGTLKIYGNGGLANVNQGKQFVFDSFKDHRIAMSQAVLTLACGATAEISDAECVNKSFPDFFKFLEKLGVKVERG